jgi:hypothetical protein
MLYFFFTYTGIKEQMLFIIEAFLLLILKLFLLEEQIKEPLILLFSLFLTGDKVDDLDRF